MVKFEAKQNGEEEQKCVIKILWKCTETDRSCEEDEKQKVERER